MTMVSCYCTTLQLPSVTVLYLLWEVTPQDDRHGTDAPHTRWSRSRPGVIPWANSGVSLMVRARAVCYFLLAFGAQLRGKDENVAGNGGGIAKTTGFLLNCHETHRIQIYHLGLF